MTPFSVGLAALFDPAEVHLSDLEVPHSIVRAREPAALVVSQVHVNVLITPMRGKL